jgi:hypothetical protein
MVMKRLFVVSIMVFLCGLLNCIYFRLRSEFYLKAVPSPCLHTW